MTIIIIISINTFKCLNNQPAVPTPPVNFFPPEATALCATRWSPNPSPSLEGTGFQHDRWKKERERGKEREKERKREEKEERERKRDEKREGLVKWERSGGRGEKEGEKGRKGEKG
eukprot:1326502-Amorphochlora_amoeboformis.AAC.1